MTSNGNEGLDLDSYAAMIALAPISFRRSAPRETIRAYWEDVHGPAISRLPGLALYTQHHLEHATGEDWPASLGGGRPAPDDQLDGVAELGFASVPDQAQFGHGVEESRGKEDDQNFVRESTVQNVRPGNSATYKNVLEDTTPNGTLQNFVLMVCFHRADGMPVEEFRESLRQFSSSLSDIDLILKVRLHLAEPFLLDDWDAPNITHPSAENQYQAFLELTFKSRLTMRLVYESAAFTSAASGIAHAVERVHAYRVWQMVCLVREGKRTLAGVYGGRVARTIAESGATLRWNSEMLL